MFRLTAAKIINYISLTWEIKKIGIISAMEYRVNFLSQVIMMMINNSFWIVLWFIFFQKFPTINGWNFHDMIALFALASANFGFLMIFLGGAPEISRIVSRGELDYYFAFPKNILWQVSVSQTVISAIGDLFFGILLFSFSGGVTIEKFLLFMVFTAITGLIFYNFSVIFQSMAFFVGNFEDAADQFFWALLGFGFYPQTVFSGFLKVIMFTILPAFFVFALPAQIIQEFSWIKLLYVIGFWLITFIIAVSIFNRGLKRYESGNLMNINM